MPVDTDPSPSEPTDLPAGWPRHWTIVGLGGVGGLYGGRLAASGADVRFLARSDVDHLRRHGLELRSPWGDAQVRDLAVAGAAAELGPSDVIVLATKTTDNARVVAQLGPLVGPSTAVLALQNGLGIEAPIAEALGVPVLGGLCFVCSAKEAPGVIVHQDYGLVTVGEHAAGGVAAGATARWRRSSPPSRPPASRCVRRRRSPWPGGRSWCGTCPTTGCRWSSTPGRTSCRPIPPPVRSSRR
ncbi:MAG: 2-dehydropantoate 2-reductase N-terminal domain-containing protein [Acidimicrobiales bacterium]